MTDEIVPTCLGCRQQFTGPPQVLRLNGQNFSICAPCLRRLDEDHAFPQLVEDRARDAAALLPLSLAADVLDVPQARMLAAHRLARELFPLGTLRGAAAERRLMRYARRVALYVGRPVCTVKAAILDAAREVRR